MKGHEKSITQGSYFKKILYVQNIGYMSCMKMFDSTAGLGKEAAVFFLLVWR
jgi:hypothetical protein